MTELLEYYASLSYPTLYGSSLLPEESRMYQEAKSAVKKEGKLSSSKHRSKAWYTPKYAEFITAVTQRDFERCSHCRSKEKLQVHHKDGYNWCEERRFDVTNGITLCEKCHKRFHKRYGEFTSFQRQFEEWALAHSVLLGRFAIYDMDISALNGVKCQLKSAKKELASLLALDPENVQLLTIREIININFDEIVYLKDQLKKRMTNATVESAATL